MQDIWNAYIDAIKSMSSEFPIEMKKPVKDSSIPVFAEEADLELPQDLIDLLKVHNGQKTEHHPILFNFHLDRLKEITHKILKKEDDDYPEEPDYYFIHPVGTIKPKKEHTHWVPLAYYTNDEDYWNRAGLYMDMDPGPQGKVGQIIWVGQYRNYRTVVADSLKDLFIMLTERLKSGNYHHEQVDSWVNNLTFVEGEAFPDTLFAEQAPDIKAQAAEMAEKYANQTHKYRNIVFGIETELPEGFILNLDNQSTVERKLENGEYVHIDHTKRVINVFSLGEDTDDEQATVGFSLNTYDHVEDLQKMAEDMVGTYKQQADMMKQYGMGDQVTLNYTIEDNKYGFPKFMTIEYIMSGVPSTFIYLIEHTQMLALSGNNNFQSEHTNTMISNLKKLAEA